jgi:hypothetical protein
LSRAIISCFVSFPISFLYQNIKQLMGPEPPSIPSY